MDIISIFFFRYALNYFENAPAPWDDDTKEAPNSDVPKKKRKAEKEKQVVTDLETAETCLRFLRASKNHFRSLWRWSEFSRKFLQHKENHVRR